MGIMNRNTPPVVSRQPRSRQKVDPKVNPVMLDVPAAAERLNVSAATVWRLIKSGDLQSVKFGGCRRVTVEAIESFVTGLSQ